MMMAAVFLEEPLVWNSQQQRERIVYTSILVRVVPQQFPLQ